MRNMTLENIVKACNGILYGNDCQAEEITGVVLDSRLVEKGSLFIATVGEKADGHKFIKEVYEAGALGVISEQVLEEPAGAYILVKDSFQALKDIAEFYRSQLNITVVAITGSVGKTTTKEFIASVLEQKYRVLKTEGNFNNEVGLPLTVLKIRAEHEIAVLEMGISDFGEMTRLSKIGKPDIGVITNIGQCHLENLGTREGILKAKTEMFANLNPKGEVCLNGEDDMLATIKEVHGKKPHTFGKSKDCDVYATDLVSKGLLGTECEIHAPGQTFSVRIPLPGEHMVSNAVAATTVGMLLGLDIGAIKKGIEAVQAVGGRSHLIQTKEYLLIDDCYNANPVSMKAAIDLLVLADNRKTAILGDMFELGENSDQMHYDIGSYAVEKGLDCLLLAGDSASYI